MKICRHGLLGWTRDANGVWAKAGEPPGAEEVVVDPSTFNDLRKGPKGGTGASKAIYDWLQLGKVRKFPGGLG